MADITHYDDPKYSPSIEECMYWAAREREHEMLAKSGTESDQLDGSFVGRIFARNAAGNVAAISDRSASPEKAGGIEKRPIEELVTNAEREKAYRAFRTAGWISIFYLITTDILGPYSAPFAFAQLGYAGGCLIFFFFGIIAAYTGFLLWWMYIKLDSSKFPIKTYSDIGLRLYGPIVKHGINILQSIQLIFNVGLIILGNGQGLSQVSKNKVCFSALCVIWTVAGIIVGQIRTLRNFGWLANCSIWLNVIVLLFTMGVASHTPINLVAQIAGGFVPANSTLQSIPPIAHAAFIRLPFTDQVVGVMQVVYSYGGAMLFVEFMAEMRRPWDFWKAMICAQLFIGSFYMLFGLVIYSFQEQYVINPANQGLSTFGWQTATNVISLIAGIIAAGLYGNIGIKVIYVHILEDLLGFPKLTTKAGKYIWVIAVPIYWSIAFIIASAIPQFSNISGIVAALCILQFTYSFPPILFLGFQMHSDAIKGDRPYDPTFTSSHRADSWWELSRWRRALGGKYWYTKIFHFLFSIAALATAGLGAYSSILGIIEGFKSGSHASTFGCQSPVA